MASSEERLQILKMLEEKKITAQEAAELLDAIEAGNEEIKVNKKTSAKWLKIKVYTEDGKVKKNIRLPISLMQMGLKIGKKFDSKLADADLTAFNMEEIMELVKQGAEGKIIDVYDEEGKTKVEISVE